MDNKPLLEDRPPAYSPAVPGGFDYGQQANYGTIPGAPQTAAQTPYQPPAYPYHTGTGYIAAAQTSYPNTYTIIQQPAAMTSVVVVGGCPACSIEDTVDPDPISNSICRNSAPNLQGTSTMLH
ncbi:membrane protein BRI3 isoform X2 [Aquarana catesbeiana]|uniref:membrane protein BRI3 isoform X2 n=1 Tax=Aquarana catesbeiana TaxID=8400 RepID=UPI003CC97978